MKSKILKPDQCSPEQLKSFYKFVEEGRQVDMNGLEDRIKAANFLAFYEDDNQLVGVASIKKPDKQYIRKVFRRAKVEKHADKYEFEMGWAFTKESHRRQGISEQLITTLIAKVEPNAVYATTKNDGMRKLLAKVGFEKLGDNYENEDHEVLTLYHYREK